MNAVWQLASDLVTNGLAPAGEQKPFDADWFAAFKDKMGLALGGSSLPSGWAAKADAYFDQALNSLFDKDKRLRRNGPRCGRTCKIAWRDLKPHR